MNRYVTASALAIVAMAGQAWADVTPQQVWDDFDAYMGNFGYEVTATEMMEGSDLVVSDLTMVITIPEEDGTVHVAMPDITFADAGDGSVNISYPDVGEIAISFVERDETVGEAIVQMMQSNVALNVSGAPGDLTYTYSGDNIALELIKFMAEGEEITRDMLSVSMNIGPLSGTSHILTVGGMRSIDQDMSMGTLALDMIFDDPESDEGGMFNMQLTGLSSIGKTVLPEELDYEDPTSMFKNGGSVDAVLKHTGGATQFTFDEGDGPTAGQFTSTGGEFAVAVSEEALTYAISGTGQTVALSGPELPLPVNAELGEFGFALEMPLAPSETPQDASLSVVIGNFAMADMLWNIFDPAEVLSRAPATVAFNLDAQVTPFISLLDTKAMEDLGRTGGMPGELNSLTLSDFVIDMVGAAVLGSGSFTFDNSDLETFDGLPRPNGQLDLQVSGANGVIDNLIAMGLLPEQDAMGFRMMMSMFTVPGEEPDTMTSTIEINEEGHILANGQRIQ
ncbi:hypothetical protein ANTHELSMS3_00117 [Antarctobacter heliothermus]|uniref:DUF2125 domain-containing protein n=1 Tax=Antarctobacter heliothermus TaxID=74033 RepID=A0A222DY48_9RHOB|nr:DUF2125 domain-containing protein [Antarctobacter heliothermus]ASP18843.1 hypothetical protein ANTHELSMS3_00117 [Antarctobacter heliothermus]